MQERFSYLLNQYYQRQASPEELEEFYTLVDSHQYDDQIREFMDKAYARETLSSPAENADGYYPPGADLRILYHVFQSENDQLPLVEQGQDIKIRQLWPRIAVAASILFILSIGGYFILHKGPTQQMAANTEQLAPVQNGVTLTLANGQKMVLSKKHSGQIATINGTRINQEDSLLNYQGKTVTEVVKMNTLTNNGSSKFSVTLADGTEAILDIGSSLTYPVAFNSTTRVVSMTGQAYFRVKHITGQRFIVKAKEQTTEDIGTEFNINAYDDEPASKTTLIEGSIRVNEQLLTPGQQAVITGAVLAIKPADIESVTAWLQGKLIFQKEPLENILKRVARIYGVHIIYQDEEVKKYTYFGSVNSTKKLSSVLNFFRKAGRVDFSVEGKTVRVFKAQKRPTNN